MNRSEDLLNFIQQNAHLFWYTPKEKIGEISDELLLEQLLNFAELPVIREYFSIVGIAGAKDIFQNLKGRQKQNIYPEIYHLFSEYFKRNA